MARASEKAMKHAPSNVELRHWFRRLAIAASSGTLGLAAGCGGSSVLSSDLLEGGGPGVGDGGGADGGVSFDASSDASPKPATDGGGLRDGGLSPYCPTGQYRPLLGVSPKEPVDYMELYAAVPKVSVDNGVTYTTTTLDAVGSVCQKATDAAACKSEVATRKAKDDPGWGMSAGGNVPATFNSLIYTRGNTVGRTRTLDELGKYLAPVDAPADALLLATQVAKRAFDCTTDKVERLADGRFQVTFYAEESGCETRSSGAVTWRRSVETTVTIALDGTFGEPKVQVLKDEATPTPGCAVAGRRLEGHGLTGSPGASSSGASSFGTSILARYLTDLGALEAESVPAFQRLALELESHGAPRGLVDAALRSAQEEVGHAQLMGHLAEAHGGCGTPVRAVPLPVRPLVELAIENAVEGCVREAYGGLVATYQGEVAKDPTLRQAFARIARDETRHGALAWAVAAWVHERLTQEERARVAQARDEAIDELMVALEHEPAQDLVREAGVPNAAVAKALLREMRQGLRAYAA